MQSVHPLTLAFRDAALERVFRKTANPRLRWHGRVALLVGLLVYLAFGLLDPFLVPAERLHTVLAIRVVTAVCGLVLLAATWHASYARWGASSRVLIGATGGLSLMAICALLPSDVRPTYYAGFLLVTFFTFNFVGASFIEALVCNVLLALSYNLLLVMLDAPATGPWMAHNFHLVGANILGGAAAYLAEHQRRRLFVAERLLLQDRERWWHDALHDPLTQLPNRALVLDRIEQALSQARRSGTQGVVMFLDLDGFKAVNDRFGHFAGDAVLQEASRRMRECLRASDTLGRLGGDEFVVVSAGVATPEQFRVLSDKLRAAVSRPYPVAGHPGLSLPQGELAEARIGASIGHCFFPDGDLGARELLMRSDEAMYRVKQARA